MTYKQSDDFSKIDRKLSLSFGVLIFGLMAVIFFSSIAYFWHIVNQEQYRLGSVIASSIGDSINRVSFSGKYQARLLIEDLSKKNQNIYAIMIQEPSGLVIAHSQKENNGAIIVDTHFEKARTVIGGQEFLIQNITIKKNGENIELIEIDMPFKRGYEEANGGIIRVFLSTDMAKNLSDRGILYLSILIAVLSILSIFVVRWLSNKISSPVKNLAYQLKGILEYAPLSIYISDKDGNILASSLQYDRINKLLTKEIEAREAEEHKMAAKVFETGRVQIYDYTIYANNKENHFHATKCPIAKDQSGDVALICTIALDITEQKEYEKKIEFLLEEQTAFFQNAVAGIIHLKGRTFIHSNEAWDRMLGYEPGELTGKNSKMIYASEEEYDKLGKDAYAQMLKSGHYTTEQVLQKKDGSTITVLLSGAYLDKSDVSKGSIWVGIDITDRKRAENELVLVNKTLEQRVEHETKKRLEAEHIAMQQSKMALMGEMIGAIAHQWRQPLNALGLTVQDIREAYKYGELNDNYLAQAVDISMDRIQFMSKTIDDFRNFFSPNKAKQEFFIEDAIKATANIVSAQLKDHKINLSYNGTGKTPFVGYQNELQQVLLNLISNSKDAIESNNSTLRKIEISVMNTDTSIFITVEDSGGGIPPHILDRVFEPYYTTKEQGKGTGIGLYMSKQIVERHMDGELGCENSDYGARFTIKLPLHR